MWFSFPRKGLGFLVILVFAPLACTFGEKLAPQTQETAIVQAAQATLQVQRTTTAVAEAIAQAVQATTQADAQATVEAQLDIGQTWALILADTFDSTDNGWYIGDFQGETFAGSRNITNGKYVWDVQIQQSRIWYSRLETVFISDFYLTVDVEKAKGPENAMYGLVFRENSDGYYLFVIGDNQLFGVQLFYKGQWETLISTTKTSAIQLNSANRLQVFGNGVHFVFLINDQYVGEADDNQLNSGKPGVGILLSEGGELIVEFDNFELRAPSE